MFKLNQLSLSVATIAATVTIGAVCSTTAQAAFIDAPVPSNAKITFGGWNGHGRILVLQLNQVAV
jgi:hypothetical protein